MAALRRKVQDGEITQAQYDAVVQQNAALTTVRQSAEVGASADWGRILEAWWDSLMDFFDLAARQCCPPSGIWTPDNSVDHGLSQAIASVTSRGGLAQSALCAHEFQSHRERLWIASLIQVPTRQ